jgi:uncharacterized protein YgiM (DUF1202 family)
MKRVMMAAAGLLLAAWTVHAAPLTATASEAFVLLNNTSVYKEKSMGVLDWAEAVTIGDKVTLTSGIVKMKVDGKEKEYYKVKLASGHEGFIRSILLGVGGTLGAVKADGVFTYSEPRDVKITERTLSRAQVVVVLKDSTSADFIHIVGYEEAKDYPFDTYVGVSDVSINDVDLQALILLSVAKGQKNAAVKKNLLTMAANKYSTSQFLDLVNAQLGSAPAPRATSGTSGTFTVNDDNVNLRDAPNEVGSKVTGTLNKGQTVTVTDVTSDQYTVAGKTAPWYKIKDGGWVFGAFLSAQ